MTQSVVWFPVCTECLVLIKKTALSSGLEAELVKTEVCSWLCKAMKFSGPPESMYAVNNLGALQTVMYKRGLQRRRRGKEVPVPRDPRSLEEDMWKEARRRNVVTPRSRAQLAEYILALEECRSPVTLIKAASVA